MTVLELLDLYDTDCQRCSINIVVDGSAHLMSIDKAIDSAYGDYEVSMIGVKDNTLIIHLT